MAGPTCRIQGSTWLPHGRLVTDPGSRSRPGFDQHWRIFRGRFFYKNWRVQARSAPPVLPLRPLPSQANKNWRVQARVGTASAAASLGFRAWFDPSLMLVACVQYCYRGAAEPLRYGLRLQVENFGALRYEKGGEALHGRALLQRHEASKADLDNFEGEGDRVSAPG